MGCDIHIHVEYKRSSQKEWICGDYYYPNPYYDSCDGEDEPFCLVGLCDDRDYTRFAVLANVRNYGSCKFIDFPRGIPADVTNLVKMDCDKWGDDGHSHSWLSLRELIDFQRKECYIRQGGLVSPESQKRLDSRGIIPEEWCQFTNIPNWEFRSWYVSSKQVLGKLIDAIKSRMDDLCVIPKWMWEKAPLRAEELSTFVRIVFWFDN